MHRGFIKIWRKLKENPWMGDPECLALWVHMLMLATHKEREVVWNGKRITLKPGQFISGRKSLSAISGIHPSKVQRILILLKTDQQIDQQPTTTSSLFSITKWETYQSSDQQNDHQAIIKRSSSDQRAITIQEVKNVKNEKNNTPACESDTPSWKNDLSIYQNEMRKSRDELLADESWVARQLHDFPRIDIEASLNRTLHEYWGTEAAWNKKRKQKGKVRLKACLSTNWTKNRVYQQSSDW